ncbi:hypothetical protein ACFFKU_06845 [Kineococcus gynurae]|uniref:Uncharacterized protein n=1 Tax=Kineococcus gynurae TaxID=452979 RepID=A0ABV5LWX7_9ACTN
MNYCGPHGIPLSTFLGWDQADQDAALGWSAHEARRYPDGSHPDDWNPELGGSRRAFHTHIDVHPGAQLIEAAQASEEFSEAGRGAHVHLITGPASECARCLRTARTQREE